LILLILVLLAVFAPLIAPYDPLKTSLLQTRKPPSLEHIFGTDELGRDLFSRILFGAQVTLLVGFSAVLLGSLFGAAIGALSAYAGHSVDFVVQRLADMLMAFPPLVLALAALSVLGPTQINATLVIGAVLAPGTNRVIRAATLVVKEKPYIDSARVIGASNGRILWRYVLPNILAPIIVIASVQLGNAIIVQASLAFLGLGPPPPTPSWGGMLSGAGRTYIEQAPWLAIFPGAAICLVVFAFNLLGDAVRDLLDPRLS
jgi:peptide/nickel transport system permease protein